MDEIRAALKVYDDLKDARHAMDVLGCDFGGILTLRANSIERIISLARALTLTVRPNE
jgi:hypothetical protein